MKDDFSKILQATQVGGFLRAYVEHTRDMEAPTSFHFFTGLTVLGAVLKRRVYFDQQKFVLFPCYQVLLSGPAGKVKKTTAAEYGVRMGLKSKEVENLMHSGSPEALWKKLSLLSRSKGGACGILYSREMSNLINKRDYSSTMIDLLMDLFDCPPELAPRETFTHGSQPISNVAVSALFCANETMLSEAMPAHAMKGGLPSRMIMLNEQTSGGRRVALLKKQPKPPSSLDDLVARLTAFRYVTGEATLSPEGERWYEDWYDRLEPRQAKLSDENLEPFFSRYSDHIMRVAMGLSVSEMDDPHAPVVIHERHFIQAEAVLEYVIERLPTLYRFLAMGPFGSDYARAVRILDSEGGQMVASDFGRKVSGGKLSRKQVVELIDTLMYNGEVFLEWGADRRQYIVRVQR